MKKQSKEGYPPQAVHIRGVELDAPARGMKGYVKKADDLLDEIGKL